MKLDAFVRSLSNELLACGLFRKQESYSSVVNSVCRFCGGSSPMLETVFDSIFLRDYENYLIRSGCRLNTISFYMTALQSIHKPAVRAGHLPAASGLFADVFTGIEATSKRAIPAEVLSRIFAADLSGKPRLEPCRDYLQLSLLLQGMAFVDLAHLRKSDVRDGVIRYHRRKTGTLVEVPLLPEAIELLEKYASQAEDSPYLLPLITLSGKAGRTQYNSAIHRQNRQLKAMAAYLGIAENLTSYVSRHCWATIAYHHDVEVGVVSQGMGHGAEGITRIYLSRFSGDRLMEANRIVLAAILQPIVEGRIKDISPEKLNQATKQYNKVKTYLIKSKRTGSFSEAKRTGTRRQSWYK